MSHLMQNKFINPGFSFLPGHKSFAELFAKWPEKKYCPHDNFKVFFVREVTYLVP